MELLNALPFYPYLTDGERSVIENNIISRTFLKGEYIHSGADDCTGLIIVKSGHLKAYITSESGKKLTLYRLEEYEMCLFSANCIFEGMDFEIFIKAEKAGSLYIIPASIFKTLQEGNIHIYKFVTELMSKRLSDVMWLIDFTVFKSFDDRLANFLVDTSALNNSFIINMTHEEIAENLATAREVVSRMLKHFENERLIFQSRGIIKIIDINGLINLTK